jgi:hypothetical protein
MTCMTSLVYTDRIRRNSEAIISSKENSEAKFQWIWSDSLFHNMYLWGGPPFLFHNSWRNERTTLKLSETLSRNPVALQSYAWYLGSFSRPSLGSGSSVIRSHSETQRPAKFSFWGHSFDSRRCRFFHLCFLDVIFCQRGSFYNIPHPKNSEGCILLLFHCVNSSLDISACISCTINWRLPHQNQIGLLKTRENLNSSDWAQRADITAVPTKSMHILGAQEHGDICVDFTGVLNPGGYPAQVLDSISFITGKFTVRSHTPNASWSTRRPSENCTKEIYNTYYLYMGERIVINRSLSKWLLGCVTVSSLLRHKVVFVPMGFITRISWATPTFVKKCLASHLSRFGSRTWWPT